MKKRFVFAVFAFAFFTCIVFAGDNSYKVTESLEIFGSYVDASKPIIEKWLCRKPK